MKKSIAMKWVQALRSGQYEQEQLVLQSGNRFCCLGVLCAIAPEKYLNTFGGIISGTSLARQPAVKEWSGVKTALGQLVKYEDSLSNLNDYEKLTFDEIADIIQILWEEL